MDTEAHTAVRWKVATASVRGKMHVRTGLPNQDACDSVRRDTTTVLAVADGHGNGRHFRSQIGSALAVQTALAVLGSLEPDCGLEEAAKLIEDSWRVAVLADLGKNPFTSSDWEGLAQLTDGELALEAIRESPAVAYGATLLAASANATRVVLLQIGDGDVLSINEAGETSRPIPADERLIGNQTTSLCQPEAYKEFRGAILRLPEDCPALLLLSTDGYANSFRNDQSFLKVGSNYLQLIRERSIEEISAVLPGILSEISENGSADDITLGILEPCKVLPSPKPLSADNLLTTNVKRRPGSLLLLGAVALLVVALCFLWWHSHAVLHLVP